MSLLLIQFHMYLEFYVLQNRIVELGQIQEEERSKSTNIITLESREEPTKEEHVHADPNRPKPKECALDPRGKHLGHNRLVGPQIG
jgi:hypothetical protein